MMITIDNNRNRMSRHRYTVNHIRMRLFRIVRMGLSRIPLTEIGQLEPNHRDSVPWIHPCPLTARGIIRHVGRLAIRNVFQMTVTFRRYLRPNPAMPCRAGDTIRSSLEAVRPKLLRHWRRSESYRKTLNCLHYNSVLTKYFTSRIGPSPISGLIRRSGHWSAPSAAGDMSFTPC
jgi:hypothetical protein